METIKRYYRVDRRHISFIKFIFEAYEGVAVVTTLDASLGIIMICASPQCGELADCIMGDLGRQFRIESFDRLPDPSPGATPL